MTKIRPSSEAVTRGVKVTVQSRYLPDQSKVHTEQYVFAYRVRIENTGPETVRLRTRHWYITEENGTVREVQGEGVVGQTPTLAPGQAFEYTSGASLSTRRGIMHGSYRMSRPDGSELDVQIAPFALELPYSLN